MGGAGAWGTRGGRFPFCFCGAGLCKKAQDELDLLADKQRICSHRESRSRDNVDPRQRGEGGGGERGAGGGPLKRGGAEQRRVLMSLFYPAPLPGLLVHWSRSSSCRTFIPPPPTVRLSEKKEVLSANCVSIRTQKPQCVAKNWCWKQLHLEKPSQWLQGFGPPEVVFQTDLYRSHRASMERCDWTEEEEADIFGLFKKIKVEQ